MLRLNTPDKSRILILDEDRVLRASLSRFLAAEGYQVQSTDSVEDAMAAMEAGRVDLLLADFALPGVNPAAFLRDIRRSFPQVVVIVLTGYGSIEGAVDAIKAGAFEYLTKPIVDDEIRVAVHKALRQQALLFENISLKQQLEARFGFESIVGRDPRMAKIFDVAATVAESRTTVLITGESGTGKSLLARAIHHRSPRRDRPFVEISCGALSETLLESELFGHVKGAFTGATSDRPGRFLSADGGTIFLDEINSASPALQVKLLRVLQERKFEPVGSTQTITVDVRVTLATNADLAALVTEGKFRQDLFYRINVVNIALPALRERKSDVTLLAMHFLRQFAKEAGREIVGFNPEAMAALTNHTWPGNVRELENAVERAVVLSRKPVIEPGDLPETVCDGPNEIRARASAADLELTTAMPLELALEGPERRIIVAALERNNWNRQQTAAELNINRTTLYKKMRKYRLDGV